MSLKKLQVLSLLILVSLFSCERYIGYGIVMLPDEENNLDSGSLIKITKESRIREAWVYNTEEEDHIEIKKWRVEFYDKLADAEAFVEKYSEFKDYFVLVNRNSHSMRIKPYADANLVYRLKSGQKVKVIGRTEEKEQIASFNGYWWELITDDGVKGWSYDSYLSVYNGDELVHSNVSEDSPEIYDFFETEWRPRYFLTMQKARNIDLDKFKTKFKMIPNIDSKEITISMPDHYATFNFTEFEKTGINNYNLLGSNVQLDFSYKGVVKVIYSIDSKAYETDFINMSDALVSEIINTENSKRKIKYTEFLFQGPTYKSGAYGEIIFSDDGKFKWNDKENLINKQLLTSNAPNEGTVSFKFFEGEDIINKYDGIITFDFGSRQELTFLYTFENSGLKLLYVPPNRIEEHVVETDDFYTPIDLFFTGQS